MARNDEGNKSMMALLIGAAMGAAGLYLSDKKNRDKVKQRWDELKEKGAEKTDELKKKGSEKLEDLQSRLEMTGERTQEEIEEAQRKLEE